MGRVLSQVCKLCRKPATKFAKAHAGIARSFFHDFRGTEPNSVLVNVSGEGKLARRIQAGVWDDEILCLDCEAKFSAFDAYGWQILGKPDLSQAYFDGNFQVGYRIKCDTDKLRRFILSSLWRASVSRIPAYEKLYLGPYETPIIERVFDETPLRPAEYPTSVWFFEKDYLGKDIQMIFSPVTNKLESGGLMCLLYLSPQLKIVTMMGDASCIPQRNLFLITKPGQFLMAFIQKDWPTAEEGYLRHFHQGVRRLRKSDQRPR
jgi:hypothetical protein